MFDVAKNPTAKFQIAGIAKTDKGLEASDTVEFLGETRGITFPVECEITGKGLHVKTVDPGFSIKQSDWGLKFKGFGTNLITDEVLINFDILAEPAK